MPGRIVHAVGLGDGIPIGMCRPAVVSVPGALDEGRICEVVVLGGPSSPARTWMHLEYNGPGQASASWHWPDECPFQWKSWPPSHDLAVRDEPPDPVPMSDQPTPDWARAYLAGLLASFIRWPAISTAMQVDFLGTLGPTACVVRLRANGVDDTFVKVAVLPADRAEIDALADKPVISTPPGAR